VNVWQRLTKKLPLEDDRDIMARIGFRFIWFTGPYFLVAVILSTFGSSKLFTLWPALFILAIPCIGGVIDWCRLKRHTKRVENSTLNLPPSPILPNQDVI
jgi:hypothetical protein